MIGSGAVVTGGTRGIGAAISRVLLERGMNVESWYLDRHKEAELFRRGVGKYADNLLVKSVDVTDPEAVESAFRDGFSNLQLELVAHCAGNIVRPADWDSASIATVRQTIELNLTSAFWIARAAAPVMRQGHNGHLLYMSSSYAINSGAGPVLAYTAAKAGIISLVRGLAAALAPDRIRVNALAPSNIDTELTQSAGTSTVQWAIDTTPLGRLGTPEEVATMALAVHDNAFMTGSIVLLDGGQTLVI